MNISRPFVGSIVVIGLSVLVGPYLPALPEDPHNSSEYGIGYAVKKEVGRITVVAPQTEYEAMLVLTR
jgi:hypothetical protein